MNSYFTNRITWWRVELLSRRDRVVIQASEVVCKWEKLQQNWRLSICRERLLIINTIHVRTYVRTHRFGVYQKEIRVGWVIRLESYGRCSQGSSSFTGKVRTRIICIKLVTIPWSCHIFSTLPTIVIRSPITHLQIINYLQIYVNQTLLNPSY